MCFNYFQRNTFFYLVLPQIKIKGMSKTYFALLVILVLFFTACSSSSKISKQTDKAMEAYQLGDFQTAYNLYLADIEKMESKQINGEKYAMMAKTCFQLKKFSEAESYFKKAAYQNFSDADMYANLISIYQEVDNLSKMLGALEFFTTNYTNDTRFLEMNIQLFEAYIASENWEKAASLWPHLDSTVQEDLRFLVNYFLALKKLKYTEEADLIAVSILKLNAANKDALEWLGEKYFWKAEKNYQNELDAYNKNKTTKQYNSMVKALDLVTADFKKSLTYFEKLYKLFPSKEYAQYMANIYNRFHDKQKTDQYQKLAK
ncbi:MAG TPA: hypothetical protein DCG69_12250 [Bacteroidales bacterium]|nr:hypothetical protein [Bacteroidales bacterium]